MNKNAIEQGVLFLLVVIVVALFAFLAWGAPPDVKPPEPSDLTRIVPYSQNFEVDFRKAIAEMTEELQQKGCKEARVMAQILNPFMVLVMVRCDKFYEETKDGG